VVNSQELVDFTTEWAETQQPPPGHPRALEHVFR
jgi:hypothetical protein